MPKNRLIYAFQGNIVKNKKYSAYFEWFEFAAKTRNKKNKKADFVQYEKNEYIMAAMQRIRKDTLVQDDFTYIEDWDKFEQQSKVWEESVKKEGIQQGIEKGIDIGKKEMIINGYLNGIDTALLSTIANLTLEEVKKIINDYKNQSA